MKIFILLLLVACVKEEDRTARGEKLCIEKSFPQIVQLDGTDYHCKTP